MKFVGLASKMLLLLRNCVQKTWKKRKTVCWCDGGWLRSCQNLVLYKYSTKSGWDDIATFIFITMVRLLLSLKFVNDILYHSEKPESRSLIGHPKNLMSTLWLFNWTKNTVQWRDLCQKLLYVSIQYRAFVHHVTTAMLVFQFKRILIKTHLSGTPTLLSWTEQIQYFIIIRDESSCIIIKLWVVIEFGGLCPVVDFLILN